MSAPTPVETATHVPCCTAHGVPMTCARYRRTHFVEVRPCCSADAEALMDLVDEVMEADTASPGHPFADVLAGTVDTRHRVDDGDITEYLAAKAEGTGMRGWS